MAQTTRALIGFLVAPAIPGAVLYVYGILKGYGDAAVVMPFILTSLGYLAALVIGTPVYVFLQRKNVRSLAGYVFAGAMIGGAFYLIFTILDAYPGQLTARLQHSRGAALVAIGYSSIAAVAFWVIAVWRAKHSAD